ncbi:MAG: DHH family phosphoesterase, partial [Oscillospiraceae bacterium]|nr:DHH family phosphoesterase [Oscillospiraceae bacterium]
FNDITDHVMLEAEHKASKKSVLLLMVDNYDEVLQNAKESGKAHVQVEVEKLFERFIEHTNGVIHKLSNGKFYAVIEQRHLGPIIERRFDILDEARSISVGERTNVTLSIGVGMGGKTLAESEIFAKQALDMCLGRGGDQAAVKIENGFEFFGGISKAVEKSTKVKSRVIATALKELVDASEAVYIMGHQYADFDAVGASVGLCGAIRSLGKRAYCVVDPDKNLSKLLIERLSQNGCADYFMSGEQANYEITDRSLLIICDTHNPDFVDYKPLYESAKQVVIVDHHRKMVNHIDNAVVFFHEPFASSTCEMATELIQYFGSDCKISTQEAEALLAGIMLDTKNFVMRSGARTFEAAAYLKKLGADTIAVKTLFSDSLDTYRQKSMLIQSAWLFHGCAIASIESDSPELRLAAPQAADELLGINGVKASFVIYRTNGVCNISARSLGGFNVQLIMEAIGGGGHQTMAGGQLGCSLEEAIEKVKDAIQDFIIKL